MQIYKILRAAEWQAFKLSGKTTGAPIDVQDGFIHFSTAKQVRETASKHFASEDALQLVAFEADAMGAQLKWEPSRGAALFPHLYRELMLSEALWSRTLHLGPDGHDFPEDLA
ncbi:Uncharacterized conserved protein, DUF952 family [Aliiroseovarius halocynthiae]|uniref:DUF952 domain-containing protein n=1 Tax=Aliiroseovarius halocynthiae TaxID=985055 RepID=A0A545SR26_9RHOB|nr:DUF952 domain-containing protein [Aliiroseovarius halocynthiae]TQV67440.1 DUF952 domain-containing protein [Aliiroseovarius halocynthiae]SMR81447.1 Uncharacterized conserved protein, DUF952 family [Aliiroseovarius halocynthiae]